MAGPPNFTALKTALPGRDFPVVGIGCSAGGLTALEKFLAKVPDHGGMAFVVVQHLDPAHTSILAELLQHVTSMVVVEVTDGVVVRPDSVYVIPPNKDLSMRDGILHLLDPTERHGMRLPIDAFLRSLAEDWQGKAVGIVLSGMGEDGASGLGAIKEKAGLTLVQTPASAQSDSMPRAAIEAGVVDLIAPPEDMPSLITAYLNHPALVPAGASSAAVQQQELDKITALLHSQSGNDFSLYKNNALIRRVERRIAMNQIDGIAAYVRYLGKNPYEVKLLFRELMIGVTEFFRDAETWDYLQATAIPDLLARYPHGKSLRAWVPACSTGEEAYSLAMVFMECLDQAKAAGRFSLQIYATDLDAEAVTKARSGLYPRGIAAGVSPERLTRWFHAEGEGYRINADIREMVVFATQNIISDPPFTKLDMLSCRNLLIYFRPELQEKILPLFSYALKPGGLLLLGNSETVGPFTELFGSVSVKSHLFRRLDVSLPPSDLRLPGKPIRAEEAEAPQAGGGENIGTLTDRLIQQTYAPAAVLINGDGDLLYVSGHTGKYLEPAAGKVNMNIHAMAREGLRDILPGAIRRAQQKHRPVHCDGLVVTAHGQTQRVDVTVEEILRPEALRGRLIVVFRDVANAPPGRSNRKADISASHDAMAQDLEDARESLRISHQDMQSSFEELTASNEELQSANEELITSKEEMQSMNEELQTVIAERQSKVESLTSVQNDMENLLNSTQIATVFLDGELKLRRYTSYATKLFKLIPGDVGRPLSDVVSSLKDSHLEEDAEEVLRSLTFLEREIGTVDGRLYRERVMPYRTQDNVVDGVVITFTDIRRLDNGGAAYGHS